MLKLLEGEEFLRSSLFIFLLFAFFSLPIIIDCSYYPRAKAPSSTGIADLAQLSTETQQLHLILLNLCDN